ncbi:MAG: hypothetical protein EPO21_21915 [Chloroflexota bacterium]|nr:MAG: hypothetical protein EPO21_21915 [Chloroflexota bacterium]
MTINNDSSTSRQPMLAERRVATVPWRSANATWNIAITVIEQTLQARRFPRVTDIHAALEKLRPLGTYMVRTHGLEGGRLEFEAEGLRLSLAFEYGTNEPDEDLSLPLVEALDPLSEKSLLTITFRTNRLLTDPPLRSLMDEVNKDGQVQVRVTNAEVGSRLVDEQEKPLIEVPSKTTKTKEEDSHGGEY